MSNLADAIHVKQDNLILHRSHSANLYGDLVDFIKNIDSGDVHSISFNDINKVISCTVLFKCHVSVVYLILAQNLFHNIQIELALRYLQRS